MAKQVQMSVCMACNFIGKPKPKGSGGIEFVLWIFYLVPGLIYHLWRHSGGNKCPECGNAMIPAHTPKAQEIIAKSEKQIEAFKEKTEEEKAADETRKKASQRSNRTIIVMAIVLLILFVLAAAGQS